MKVNLKTKEVLNYYGHLILVLGAGSLFLFGVFRMIQFLLFRKMIFTDYLFIIFFLIITLIVTRYWANKLKYIEFKFDIESDEFRKIVQSTAQELNWELKKLSNNHVLAYRNIKIMGIGGERIEIFRNEEKKIMGVNSIPNPEKNSIAYSRKQNEENITTFLKNCLAIESRLDLDKQILERKNQKKSIFLAENEWTFLKIFQRIIVYSLTILFIALGINSIKTETINLRGLLALIGGLAFFIIYIITDIQIIIKKTKQK